MTTSAPCTIRRATAADAERVSSFARRVFDATFGPDNAPADMEAYGSIAFTTAAQEREITDPTRVMLLAESEGELAAYTLLRAGSTEPSVTGPAPVEVERFYVDHTWHGRGVAGALMDAAMSTARLMGGSTLWLGVWERNARAIRFYRKRGFTDVGSHPFTLGSDLQVDRVMARAL